MTRILIVEDNEQMRRVIRNVIGDLGAVREIADGAQALNAYAEWKPDWVLMDIKMEKVNGITATREIKAAFPDARIIIVTNYDDADLREAARKAGACSYVLKEDLLSLRHIVGRLPKQA
ncbi:MAG TPA: response regulator transcription factor [Blastocatellia bacterium]|nr:response regulator transcription factor [Blastocatellia bacterium]